MLPTVLKQHVRRCHGQRKETTSKEEEDSATDSTLLSGNLYIPPRKQVFFAPYRGSLASRASMNTPQWKIDLSERKGHRINLLHVGDSEVDILAKALSYLYNVTSKANECVDFITKKRKLAEFTKKEPIYIPITPSVWSLGSGLLEDHRPTLIVDAHED